MPSSHGDCIFSCFPRACVCEGSDCVCGTCDCRACGRKLRLLMSSQGSLFVKHHSCRIYQLRLKSLCLQRLMKFTLRQWLLQRGINQLMLQHRRPLQQTVRHSGPLITIGLNCPCGSLSHGKGQSIIENELLLQVQRQTALR